MNCRTGLMAAGIFAAASMVSAETITFYIGTGMSATSPSQGIYRSTLDTAAGKLSDPVLAGQAVNPTFLEIHPNGNFLYAACGMSGQPGTLNSFAIDRATGNLKPINEQPSGGTNPLHVSIDQKAQVLLVANYGDGVVESVPIASNGSLGAPASTIRHTGSSVNAQRQAGPHAHSIFASPDNNYVYVPDLGIDKIMIYRLDSAKATLTPNNPASVQVTPGSGPRHFIFHPNGKFLYLLTELNGTVIGYNYNAANGALTEFQTISVLPDGYAGAISCAEIRVHPSGRFLYASNRGNNAITVFQVDPANGRLTVVEQETAGLNTPRNFNVDPTGAFLLAANQNGNSISLYRINQETGALDIAGPMVLVPTPLCIRFLR